MVSRCRGDDAAGGVADALLRIKGKVRGRAGDERRLRSFADLTRGRRANLICLGRSDSG